MWCLESLAKLNRNAYLCTEVGIPENYALQLLTNPRLEKQRKTFKIIDSMIKLAASLDEQPEILE